MTAFPYVPFQDSKMRIERARYRLGVFAAGQAADPGLVLRAFVRDLVAALDSVVVDIARVKSQDPEDLKFPFAESRQRLADIVDVDFRRIDEELVAHLKSLKPFPGGHPDLFLLHALDSGDGIALAQDGTHFAPDHAHCPGAAVYPLMERLFAAAADTVHALGARFGRRA